MKLSWKIFEMLGTLHFFFKQKIKTFLGDVFFKIPNNLILGVFSEADTKTNRYASAKTSNAALVKPTD